MAKAPRAFDVWFVAANTVYKGVPYNVVADWAQQGRLAPTDMVRPSGTKEGWVTVGEHEFLADYVPRPAAATAATPPAAGGAATGEPAAPAAAVELPDPEPGPRRSRFEEDDDVDMIPLIDISMVLLVFFIMIQATGALPTVEVPEMRYAGSLTADPEAITITIEKVSDPTAERPEDREKIAYSVRVGNVAPQPKHDNLPTPEAALVALNEALVGATRPPEVRIACRYDLPRERVYELRRELEPLRKKGIINSVVATVVEAPENK